MLQKKHKFHEVCQIPDCLWVLLIQQGFRIYSQQFTLMVDYAILRNTEKKEITYIAHLDRSW